MQKARVKGKWGSNAVITEKGEIVEPRMLGEGLRPSAVTRDLKWGVEVPKLGKEEEDSAMEGKVICELASNSGVIGANGHRCLGQSRR
jgi:methionyl-tRNA synthetase